MLHSVLEEDEQCVRANSPPRCDGHHKMSNWVPSMNRFTVEPRDVELRVAAPARMVRAGLNGEEDEQDYY
jgi:hypothetical protein